MVKLADGARWDAAVARGISLNASHVLLQGQASDEPQKPPFSWPPKEKYQAASLSTCNEWPPLTKHWTQCSTLFNVTYPGETLHLKG